MSRNTKKHSASRLFRRFFYALTLLLVVVIASCVHKIKTTVSNPSLGDVWTCDLLQVHDGDTLSVECNGQRKTLRLYCIDAPELAQAPWGKMSKNHLASILGKQFFVEYRGIDRYGRTVARINDAAIDMGARMVRDGYAVVYPKYCPSSEAKYYANEKFAKQQRLVVWRTSGSQSEPWVWRNNR